MASKKNSEEVFNKAIELSDAVEQAEYLDQACAGDEKLHAEVDALLKWHTEAGDFLEVPPVDPDVTVQTSAVEGSGTVIGRYKLLEKVGEGGMATVYMAEQRRPIRRRVALKIIKLGMDTKQVIGRFEAERQALAMMDHPNIAKVLDAGTTETGRPYFVMELVRGLSITEFCDKNSLSTRERLELFMSVCHAVQHAHQRGIIHRDIKPSNVLVTLHDGEPVAKVIDFGIAKAVNQQLTEKTVFTRYSQMIGTPEYMSPEQAEMSGLDIDTRTDVFSLGVLLYELLTGTTPFDSEYLLSKGYGELQRIIREEEPIRPSTKVSTLGEALANVAKHRKTSPELLRKLIRTDLDWIVMKTLEKDRNRRYESVSEFAADIKRHLDNEPVLAGRPSTVYRIKKFVQRRRTLVTAAIAVAAAIAAGFIVSTTLYLKVRQSHRREATALAEAESVIAFLTDDLLSSVFPERAKSQQVTVRYIIEAASEKLKDRFKDKPRVEAEIRDTLGQTYCKLGDYEAAEPHLRQVWELRKMCLGEDDPVTLAALWRLGRTYMLSGRYKEGEPLLLNAVDAQTRVLGKEHQDTLQSLCDLAQLYGYWGYFDKAAPVAEEALELGRSILGEEHLVTLSAMQCCAWIYLAGGVLEKAEPLAEKGYEISRRLLGEEHEDTIFYMVLLAWIYQDQERPTEAIPIAVKAMEKSRQVLGEEHWKTAAAMSQLGSLYCAQGRYSEAEPLLLKSVELSRRVVGEGHVVTLVLMMRLAQLYGALGQDDEMEAMFAESLEIGQRDFGTDHFIVGFLHWSVIQRTVSLGSQARELYDAGKYAEALESLTRQKELRGLLDAGYAQPTPSDVSLLAMSLHRLGRKQEAISALQRLRGMFEESGHNEDERSLCEAEKLFVDKESQVYKIWDLIEEGAFDEAAQFLEMGEPPGQEKAVSGPTDRENIRRALSRIYCVRGMHWEGRGEYQAAMSAYMIVLRIDPDSANAHNRLAHLLVSCPDERVRDGSRAIEHATKACEIAHWQDASYLTTLAAVYAELGDFRNAIRRQTQAIDLYEDDENRTLPSDYAVRLRLYNSGKAYRRTTVVSWDFEQSHNSITEDSSGNGLDGRLIGDAKIVNDPDRGGRVLCLDGNSDWLDCGRDPQFDITSEITVACWIKIVAFDKRFQTIISKGDDSWRLARNSSTNAVEFGCTGVSAPGNIYGAVYGEVNVNDDRWHQLVGVYDGATVALYVDGVLDVSSKASGEINTNAWKVLIGENEQTRARSAEERSFSGLIDDVRIYDYALTESEIKALYAGSEAMPAAK